MTKTQLKQLIREELQKAILLNEAKSINQQSSYILHTALATIIRLETNTPKLSQSFKDIASGGRKIDSINTSEKAKISEILNMVIADLSTLAKKIK